MKKLLLLLASSLFVVACAGTVANQNEIADAESVDSAKTSSVDESAKSRSTRKSKPCRTGSRLKNC